MEVDAEVEGELVAAMSVLGTVDRETLVRRFRELLFPSDVSEAAATFFLDANNWNLQQAVGAFYDLALASEGAGGNPAEALASMLGAELEGELVRDATVGEGESVPARTRFRKTWRLRNPRAGSTWPPGCFLKHIEGPQLASTSQLPVPALSGGEEADVSVEMESPPEAGIYQSRWQLNSPQGVPFGETIWSIVVVEEGGLLGITQQMAGASCLGSVASPAAVANPFALASAGPFAPQASLSNTSIGGGSGTDTSSAGFAGDVEVQFDAPASPNGSSALCQAIQAAFPAQARTPTAAVAIPDAQPPAVPPCTPSTPPPMG